MQLHVLTSYWLLVPTEIYERSKKRISWRSETEILARDFKQRAKYGIFLLFVEDNKCYGLFYWSRGGMQRKGLQAQESERALWIFELICHQHLNYLKLRPAAGALASPALYLKLPALLP